MTQTLSKKQVSVALYRSLTAAGKSRKEIIAEFRVKAGLTPAGASTYYHNIHTGLWTEEPGTQLVTDHHTELSDEILCVDPTAHIKLYDTERMSIFGLTRLVNQVTNRNFPVFADRTKAMRAVSLAMTGQL